MFYSISFRNYHIVYDLPHCRVYLYDHAWLLSLITRFELNYFANCSNVAEFHFNLAIKKLYTQLRDTIKFNCQLRTTIILQFNTKLTHAVMYKKPKIKNKKKNRQAINRPLKNYLNNYFDI